jgi:hypothetical protein
VIERRGQSVERDVDAQESVGKVVSVGSERNHSGDEWRCHSRAE